MNLLKKLDRLIIENRSIDNGAIDKSDQRAMRNEIMLLIDEHTEEVSTAVRLDEASRWLGVVGRGNVSHYVVDAMERHLDDLRKGLK